MTAAGRLPGPRRWLPAALKLGGLALVLVLAVSLPFLTGSFYVSLGTQALYLGLFALPINLLAGYGGMITLGQAGVSGIAGYGLAIFLTRFNWPLGVAAVAALAVTVAAAAFLGALAMRTSGVYFLMVTLAEGMVIWGIAQRWNTVTGGDNGVRGVTRPGFADVYWKYYYFTLVVVALCVALIALVVRSPFGLTLRGIRESEGRMGPLGYNVALHKLVAFTVAGFFAGVSGLLLAMDNNFFSPTSVHLKASADGLLMSILGGMGTLTGAFVGSGVFVFITNYVSGYLTRWPTLLGLIFVLVILFARDGIVGAWNRWVWAPLLRRAGQVEEAELAEEAAREVASGLLSGPPASVATKGGPQ